MRTLVVRNVVVAAVLGVARLDDESLAAAAGLLVLFLPDLDVPTSGGAVKGTLVYLPLLPDESRRDLTRALFSS